MSKLMVLPTSPTESSSNLAASVVWTGVWTASTFALKKSSRQCRRLLGSSWPHQWTLFLSTTHQ